eukprot:CAMPEP_0117608006 /NCGR_PEP_ID=MMETSP0784-20121206/80577_1 /TAXON_ID=39447 /ORGANISM="" /LENGTH=112 /DNA_ID=CAMNT_0005411249 /DNA_START=271 /DNA_END=606 /DNA_ORIENTATION=-
MEIGVCVTMGLPKPGPIAYVAAPRKLTVWLSLDSSTSELRWATLEQRRGRPLEEGHFLPCEIMEVRNTGCLIELFVKGRSRPIVLEFNTPSERDAWGRYIELAFKVLGVDNE